MHVHEVDININSWRIDTLKSNIARSQTFNLVSWNIKMFQHFNNKLDIIYILCLSFYSKQQGKPAVKKNKGFWEIAKMRKGYLYCNALCIVKQM